MSFYPFALHEISVLIELILGHLRYRLTDVPPQPNSPPDSFFNLDRRTGRAPGHLTGRYHGGRAALLQHAGAKTWPCGLRHEANPERLPYRGLMLETHTALKPRGLYPIK